MINNDFMEMSGYLENSHLQEWKEGGGKVIGFYCANMPEEIIYAAGMLPFRIRGTTNTDYLLSDTLLSRFNCTYVRSTLNLALNKKYDFLDGLLVANTCDHIRRMYDIFKRKVEKVKSGKLPLFFVSLPHKFSDEGWKWTREELELFGNEFSNEYGVKIGDEDLQEALDVYSENSRLMQEINQFRNGDKPRLSGTDFFKITLANSSVRKDFANRELKKIIKILEGNSEIENIRARLMLIGSTVDMTEFISIFEHSGGLVVSDSICTGIRSYLDVNHWNPDIEIQNDVMDKLIAKSYSQSLCPRMINGHTQRLDFIKNEIKNSKIDGVVLQRIEFCDLHGCENMLYQHELESLGIPVLSLDREHFLGDTGRLRTRTEAFLEKIG